MKKVVLSAFACDPLEGSEPGNGWNWAVGLAKNNFEVHCYTRNTGKKNIESQIPHHNVIFNYVVLPYGLEKLYGSSTVGMYCYYILWQFVAFKMAKRHHKKLTYDMAHHVTWGSTQMGSFMYRLKIPFVFGPAGGGQVAPIAFKEYFKNHWETELKREKVSNFLLKYNPACKQMLRNSYAVLSSNPDTEKMVKAVGAKNVYSFLDAALPDKFFPASVTPKLPNEGKLKLLWVGRFLPRKGVLLLLDVMNQLKKYPGITLTVVGDGEMKDNFLHKIKEYQLEDTVNWVGKVPYDTVKQYYKVHDVFFFTSLRDSCPAQLIEAMAYSMPVITLKLHGQEVIVDDSTGASCICTTPEIAICELKKAILDFYNNQDLIIKKGNAAYKFAKNQTWNNKIEHIINTIYPKI